jgi:tetratricopeptide (TPR) repeat protein
VIRENLASACEDARRFTEAATHWEALVRLRHEHLGPHAAATAQARGHLAEAYRRIGQLDSAVAQYERALQDDAQVTGEHAETLRIGLALAHKAAGRYEAAAQQLRIVQAQREWERVDPSRLAEDEQLLWARIAGRQVRYEERQQFAEKLARASRECREAFLMSCAAENPNRRLRLSALGDRVAVSVDRADFDDLVTMVTSAPTWDKDRVHGVRVLLRAIGEGTVQAPEDILSRWTWRLARATRKLQDRRASADLPEAKRLLGALTNSRGHRHEENAARLVNVALEQPIHVAVGLLASAEAYTPTAQRLIEGVRERVGSLSEVANALADNLPAPKPPSGKSRRRRRKKRKKAEDARRQSHAQQAKPEKQEGRRPTAEPAEQATS